MVPSGIGLTINNILPFLVHLVPFLHAHTFRTTINNKFCLFSLVSFEIWLIKYTHTFRPTISNILNLFGQLSSVTPGIRLITRINLEFCLLSPTIK